MSVAIYKILFKLPAIIVIFISWYLSSQERVPMPDFANSDKLVHFICFGGLAFCFAFWFCIKNWKKHIKRNSVICIALTSLYGIIDEIHQSFTPGRSCSVFDWLADTAGATAGIFVYVLLLSILINTVWRTKYGQE
ncbi:MAG: VanZ family protein [Treponema sp.]|nr:VanZ family protein [Treponema sp.]